MTQEDKQLLLKDLCVRLPYKILCADLRHGDSVVTSIDIEDGLIYCFDFDEWVEIEQCKPYLRPMSSMTEEEKKDLLETIVGNEGSKYFRVLSDGSIDNTDATVQDLNKFNMHWVNFDRDTVTSYLDWLNAHHFDYRGLIERGLAIAVTEENNPYKQNKVKYDNRHIQTTLEK